MEQLSNHVSLLTSLGFTQEKLQEFQNIWKLLEADGYELYGLYTGSKGSPHEGQLSCIICSKNSKELEWDKVTTPSMDSAAIFSTCGDCRMQYVEAALRQKALGRLLKERNTRPN